MEQLPLDLPITEEELTTRSGRATCFQCGEPNINRCDAVELCHGEFLFCSEECANEAVITALRTKKEVMP